MSHGSMGHASLGHGGYGSRVNGSMGQPSTKFWSRVTVPKSEMAGCKNGTRIWNKTSVGLLQWT